MPDAATLKDFGLPVFLLLCFVMFFWKGIWPDMVKQRDLAQQQAGAAIEAMHEIKQALAAQNEISREVINVLKNYRRVRRDAPTDAD